MPVTSQVSKPVIYPGNGDEMSILTVGTVFTRVSNVTIKTFLLLFKHNGAPTH